MSYVVDCILYIVFCILSYSAVEAGYCHHSFTVVKGNMKAFCIFAIVIAKLFTSISGGSIQRTGTSSRLGWSLRSSASASRHSLTVAMNCLCILGVAEEPGIV